jgi:RsiW-degrading membrane proteinase PrsW (M82 family)
VVCALALSSWEALLTRDSPGAHWTVALLGIGAVVTMIVLGQHRQRRTARAWASRTVEVGLRWRAPRALVVGALIWGLLIVGVIGWDLFSFVVQSSSFPTLSNFVGHVIRYRIGRGLLFAFWLVAGSYLVAGWRARTPE